MKYEQLQKEILHQIFMENCIAFDKKEKNINFILNNGSVLFIVPKCFNFIEVDNINESKVVNTDVIIKTIDFDNYKPVELSKELMETRLDGKKTILNCFNIDDEKIYINQKNLKFFNLDEINFKVKNKISSVLVYEHNELRAIIMPVRVK
ncbi:MAG: hypothetical protein IKG27_05715 [Bacilli bacterium]|nr:hypothetical protein [Bacilli bacterium]